MIKFSNTYETLPPQFYEKVNPETFESPQLISFNHSLASELGLDFKNVPENELAKVFSGQKILNGSTPLAMAYAGYQFGHPVPQLGDGRAHLLGEVNGQDIQLKGSGRTRFSRRGDGRSALGPVLREYIVSEAMHALGVPTTRALCAVTTGEKVHRQDGPEPGGIFTRVAKSHLRVGTFQYFAFQHDYDSIKILIDYTIKRHYPELNKLDSYSDKSIQLLKIVTEKQSELISLWSSLGFIHGVMNTDNFSMAGITIDYGPCAFMDEFKFNKVFSSIDHQGRYSYFNQINMAKWNILRLAECFLPLIDSNQEKSIEKVEHEIVGLFPNFEHKRMVRLGRKLGIEDYKGDDEKLIMLFLEYLEKESLDFTLAFRNLESLWLEDFTFYPETIELKEFKSLWSKRVSNISNLSSFNPIYIPRNHQIQKVIDDANNGDYRKFHKLIQVISSPFQSNPDFDEYALPPKPAERVHQTFCGT